MRLHRFYHDLSGDGEISAGTVFEVPSRELVHQLKDVFRLRAGDGLVLFCGDGLDHECAIEGFGTDAVSLKAVKSEPSRFMPLRDLGREIRLCAAVVKKDTFEWIVEKATELGVSHIVPIMSERSEKKSLNMERLGKIVIEASEQSGRGDVPKIEPIRDLEETIDFLRKENPALQIVAFHTEGEAVQDEILYQGKAIAVFVGPEGGWSEAEIELFKKKGASIYCLGKQVLRAETAAVAAISRVVF